MATAITAPITAPITADDIECLAVGAWILALGLFLVLFTLIHAIKYGERAPANPWNAVSLEWSHTASPPIEHNFEHEPVVKHGPYDYDDVVPPQCDPKDYPLAAPLPEGARGH